MRVFFIILYMGVEVRGNEQGVKGDMLSPVSKVKLIRATMDNNFIKYGVLKP
jgi:hypothetical protein